MDIELLKELCAVQSVSGYESRIGKLIISKISAYFDECRSDRLGNIIAYKKGVSKAPKKILFFSHMDECGFLTTHIEDNGRIRFSALGDTDISCAMYRRVCFENGAKGLMLPESADPKNPTFNNFYVDIGAKNKEEAEKAVTLGETFVIENEFTRLGEEKICARALDGRAPCAALISASKEITECENDIYFVFSVQKNVGNRGMKPAAFGIAPDIAISFDCSLSSHKDNTASAISVGGGVGIKIKDKSVICHEILTDFIRNIVKNANLSFQNDLTSFGTSELAAVQASHSGAMVAGITIPCQNPNSCAQIMSLKDIENAQILAEALLKADFSALL